MIRSFSEETIFDLFDSGEENRSGIKVLLLLNLKEKKMYRKLFILVFIASIFVQAKLSWSENYTFRNTRWGMTAEEVIASESKLDPIEKNENIIKYETYVLGKNVELVYLFVKNQLIGSSYKINENYLNSQHFITSYRKFKAALTTKYGSPKVEETNWQNDALRNRSSKSGLALSLGHVDYHSSWETPNTTISSSLKEENYYVLCSVIYRSKELSGLRTELKKEDELDPL